MPINENKTITLEECGIWQFSAQALQSEIIKEGLIADKLTRLCGLRKEISLWITGQVLFNDAWETKPIFGG